MSHCRRLFVLCACLPGILAVACADAGPSNTPRPVVFRTQTMGTWASLTLVTADSASMADLAYDALRAFHRVDSLMSNWSNVSEVARINREAAQHEVTVHPEVAQVLGFGQRVTADSQGAFDMTIEPLVRLWGFLGGEPRVPEQREIDIALERVGPDKLRFNASNRTLRFTREGVSIDLGGIAKGHGVDVVADLLRRASVTDALIDLSGNMVALGNAAGRTGWTVGIRDPSGKTPYLARLRLHDEAVATSGDYEQFVDEKGERYGHIIDPRTGWSAHGLSSVTIVSDRAITADAWATALFVLGPEAARRIARERDDMAVVLIEPQADGVDVIWVEEPLRTRFELREDLDIAPSVRHF